jgi:hypothetical protein
MNNLILLFVCFIRMLLRRSGRMPENAPATINVFISYIFVPALTLLYLHDFEFGAGGNSIQVKIFEAAIPPISPQRS